MNQERLHGRLELAELRLLMCKDRDKANQIAEEIHAIKGALYERRKRDRQYRTKHQQFQRTGAGS